MRKFTVSIIYLFIIIVFPTASLALTVNFYQATMSGIASTNRFATLGPGSGGCVNLAGARTSSSGTTVTIANSGGTARACIVNGSTTDEVRLFNAKITVSTATTIVIEIVTTGTELTSGAAGTYSFAAALKNVAALSSSNAPKTANGILFKTIANGNEINQSGSVSVSCGATSAGTVTWSSSSTCNKTEKELSLSANSTISHVSRYEFKTTAANDFFNFPASGHGLISKVTDVDGGSIEIEISLGTETAVQYPFAENYTASWESPTPGGRASLTNTIPIKANLLRATAFDSGVPLLCDSILSNQIVDDDKCSMGVATSRQWRDITELKAKWIWDVTGGNCAKSWRFMVELAELVDPDDPSLGFKRFYFDNGKTFDTTLPDGGGYKDCTTNTFSEVNIADKQNKAPNWDLTQVGGSVNDTYSKSLSSVGRKNLRQIAIMLDPHPDGETDQRVKLFELVLNGNVFRPITSVQFAQTPTNELPLQGVEYRITKADNACQVILKQDSGQIEISGGRYLAHLKAESLCGVGEYRVRFHLNGNPIPLEGSTFFFLN